LFFISSKVEKKNKRENSPRKRARKQQHNRNESAQQQQRNKQARCERSEKGARKLNIYQHFVSDFMLIFGLALIQFGLLKI